mmetsp:Transcript_36068/g.73555  ORF Transcript_36068/g.73555 Transcript_36068/m.73555 type:complete len:82 (+) Transcript_36068:493-738(+)
MTLPDLLALTHDGKYLMIAFRGPNPVSVSHAAQGSCHGVRMGSQQSTNTVDTVHAGTIQGGRDYTGAERSDVHGVIVVSRK